MEEKAIGLVETHRVVAGIVAADAMLKAAEVDLIDARSTCIGKFIVLIRGAPEAVRSAVAAGIDAAGEALADHCIVPGVHPAVVAGIDSRIPTGSGECLGLVETTTVAACLVAADVAVKAADVTLLELRVANHLGGKCYFMLWGDREDIEAAVSAASATVSAGALVQRATIPDLQSDLKRKITLSRGVGRVV
jgi:microcompartment protein CcmL/EutN